MSQSPYSTPIHTQGVLKGVRGLPAVLVRHSDYANVRGERFPQNLMTLTEAARLLGSGSSTTFGKATDRGMIAKAASPGAVRSRPMLNRAEVLRFASVYVTLAGLQSEEVRHQKVLAILTRAGIEPVISGSAEGRLYIREEAEAALAVARKARHAPRTDNRIAADEQTANCFQTAVM